MIWRLRSGLGRLKGVQMKRISEQPSAVASATAKRVNTGGALLVLRVSSDKLGMIIGKGGENIREIKARTQSQIQLPPRGSYSQNGPPVRVNITIEGGDLDEAAYLVRRACFRKGLPPKFEGVVPSNVKKIYVDALNFIDSHFFVDIEDWSIEPVLKRTQALADACKAHGIELIGFIDAVRTDEALDKWRDRMARNVLNGTRNVPQNISGIIAALFRHCNLEVRLSTEMNNDDTLAAYAHHEQVPILSGDKDYLRYQKPDGSGAANLTLYTDYRVRDGQLLLQPRISHVLNAPLENIIIAQTLPSFQRFGVDEDAWVANFHRTLSFRGGAPSPLVRTLQFNPYLRIRPLREGLYWELLRHRGVSKASVKEEFPTWVDNKVVFAEDTLEIDTTVPFDPLMLQLLREPKRAFEHFFPREMDKRAPPGDISDGDWYRHCHGCRVIVIELSCYLPGASHNFLDVLIESDQWAH